MAEGKTAPQPQPETKPSPGPAKEIERRPGSTPGLWGEHPLAFMGRFAREMDRIFEDFGVRMPRRSGRGLGLLRPESEMVAAGWSPRIDVQEREGHLVVRADLPGLSKDDVKVEVTDDQLTIQGERKLEKKEEREGYSYSECSYGSFFRAIPLPEGIDASKATAEFRNGVLEIAMPAPSRNAPQARRLEIRDAK